MLIRDAKTTDEAVWRRLWDGYVTFYKTVLAEEVTRHTWARILDPASPMFARLAEIDGQVVGFAVSLLHEGTWALTPTCYLEDLFVDAACRGQGIGRALIEDLRSLAHAKGWSSLYWNTQTDNPADRKSVV